MTSVRAARRTTGVGTTALLIALVPCAVFAITAQASARSLSVDTHFADHGLAELPVATSGLSSTRTQIDSQGRIVVATGDAASSAITVARFLPGGRVDQQFGNGGAIELYAAKRDQEFDLRPLDSGATSVVSFSRQGQGGRLFTLDESGSLEGPPAALQSDFPVEVVAVTPEGLPLVAGSTGPPTETPNDLVRLERFLADGTPDPSWGNGGIAGAGESSCLGENGQPGCVYQHSGEPVAIEITDDGAVGVATSERIGHSGDTEAAGLYVLGPTGSRRDETSSRSSIALRATTLAKTGVGFAELTDRVFNPDQGFRVSTLELSSAGAVLSPRTYALRGAGGYLDDPWHSVDSVGGGAASIWTLSTGGYLAHLLSDGKLENLGDGPRFTLPSGLAAAKWTGVAAAPGGDLLLTGVSDETNPSRLLVVRLLHADRPPRLRLLKLRRRATFKGVRKHGIVAKVGCDSACSVRMQVRVGRATASKLGLRSRTIARHQAELGRNNKGLLRARIKRPVIAAIRRVRPRLVRYHVTLRATAAKASGGTGARTRSITAAHGGGRKVIARSAIGQIRSGR